MTADPECSPERWTGPIDELIRDYASRGMSKRQVMAALGLSTRKLAAICEYIPGIKWQPRGHTLGDKEARDSQRGVCTEAHRVAGLKGNQARSESCKIHTAFGTTACMRDLVNKYGVVSRLTVRRRLKAGWALESALVTPAQRNSSKPPSADHPWRRF